MALIPNLWNLEFLGRATARPALPKITPLAAAVPPRGHPEALYFLRYPTTLDCSSSLNACSYFGGWKRGTESCPYQSLRFLRMTVNRIARSRWIFSLESWNYQNPEKTLAIFSSLQVRLPWPQKSRKQKWSNPAVIKLNLQLPFQLKFSCNLSFNFFFFKFQT